MDPQTYFYSPIVFLLSAFKSNLKCLRKKIRNSLYQLHVQTLVKPENFVTSQLTQSLHFKLIKNLPKKFFYRFARTLNLSTKKDTSLAIHISNKVNYFLRPCICAIREKKYINIIKKIRKRTWKKFSFLLVNFFTSRRSSRFFLNKKKHF